MITLKDIDNGKAFDWGRTSEDYSKFRDIYPPEFYEKILSFGLCTKGQTVLDIGTGTGVIPRNMYQYGAKFIGSDIAENQILFAKQLSKQANMDIDYLVSPAEEINFPDNTFDVATACQCFVYFDKAILLPNLVRMLKPEGRFAILFLNWLPKECEIANESEKLVLKYNPTWTGANMQRHFIQNTDWANELFDVEHHTTFDVNVRFTRDSWNGRIRACRGVGASLPEDKIEEFNKEHMELLEKIAPKSFDILHLAEMVVLKVKK